MVLTRQWPLKQINLLKRKSRAHTQDPSLSKIASKRFQLLKKFDPQPISGLFYKPIAIVQKTLAVTNSFSIARFNRNFAFFHQELDSQDQNTAWSQTVSNKESFKY